MAAETYTATDNLMLMNSLPRDQYKGVISGLQTVVNLCDLTTPSISGVFPPLVCVMPCLQAVASRFRKYNTG